MRTMVVLVSALVILVTVGCTRSVDRSTVPTSAASASTPVITQSTATTRSVSSTDRSLPATAPPAVKRAPAPPRPSSTSLAYAKRLGGTSHQGEKLFFVIGDSVGSEREAQSLLDRAIPRFGDMQSYFVVQRSDNFSGLRPGWWVIIEAYRKSPSAENRQFGKRGFPNAYVKQATVLTNDPIPVYDDLVPK